MSLELNVLKWCECFGNELGLMSLKQPNFVAQDDECYHHRGNQA